MKLSEIALGAVLATSSMACDDSMQIPESTSNTQIVTPEQQKAERGANCKAAIERAGKIPFSVDLPDGQWAMHRHNSILYVKTSRDGVSRTFDPRKETVGDDETVKRVFVTSKTETPTRTDCDETKNALAKWRVEAGKILNDCDVPRETVEFVDSVREDTVTSECGYLSEK